MISSVVTTTVRQVCVGYQGRVNRCSRLDVCGSNNLGGNSTKMLSTFLNKVRDIHV